ncbi:MAG: DUF456 domain-containing protein [Proteobacteria bacterium]|nr:DUF456 domain-containing protein [Pseudomonadota bacterium]
MNILAFLILIIFSLAGFTAIFFTNIGTLIIFVGIILFAYLTNFLTINTKALLIILFFYLCGEVAEYLLPAIGAKKFGSSNKAVIGAIAGGILGAIIGVGFLGIGALLGTFLGIFLGAFLVEIFIQKDLLKSIKAGAGGVVGRIGAIAAKLIIAVIMLAVVIIRVINH